MEKQNASYWAMFGSNVVAIEKILVNNIERALRRY